MPCIIVSSLRYMEVIGNMGQGPLIIMCWLISFNICHTFIGNIEIWRRYIGGFRSFGIVYSHHQHQHQHQSATLITNKHLQWQCADVIVNQKKNYVYCHQCYMIYSLYIYIFGKCWKQLGIGSDPSLPWLGQDPKFRREKKWDGSPKCTISKSYPAGALRRRL